MPSRPLARNRGTSPRRYRRRVPRPRTSPNAARIVPDPLLDREKSVPQRGLGARQLRRLRRSLHGVSPKSGAPTPSRLAVIDDLVNVGVLKESEVQHWHESLHVGDEEWEILRELHRAYPPNLLGITVAPAFRRSRSTPTLVGASWFAVLVAGGLVVADLTVVDVSRWLNAHNWTTAMAGSLIVVLVTYTLVERSLDRGESAKWTGAAAGPLIDHAQELAELRQEIDVLIAGLWAIECWPPPASVPAQRGVDQAVELADLDRRHAEAAVHRLAVQRRLRGVRERTDTVTALLTTSPTLVRLVPSVYAIDGRTLFFEQLLMDPSPEIDDLVTAERELLYETLNDHLMILHAVYGPSAADRFYVEPIPRITVEGWTLYDADDDSVVDASDDEGIPF